jgi:hypothetical protein
MMPPPLRRRLSSPTPGPPPSPQSVWTPAKEKAVLEGFRSYVANAAKKHGIPPDEVTSLIKDHLSDPGD